MMREFGKSLGNAVMENVGRAVGRAQERKPLPADLLESDDAFLAVFDAPGATASDVQARLQDNVVEVRIDRFRDFHEGFEMRYPGRGLSLDGRVTLPESAVVDPEGTKATLEDNGTLVVRIPKATASDDRVDIDVSEQEAAESEQATGEDAADEESTEE
ncbi:Hsp20/alpha crystallin family protein [Haloarculaceae archaeon H-GB2-1]|nr:Hsp20/alpha crystallin family protein [Haloarculaceae archaeon H-GB1-1]MEA5387698.1 Hsp20/alpha crystallin family protein [Haloarculaceae archaeon H-GB11]MEA5409188.1 Hsp20/alpha crystallin family protein [Haloarculaceae archaeon H-GB2-1]